MRTSAVALLGALLLSAGCSHEQPASSSTASPAATVAPIDNGRAIFQTGRDLAGTQIVAQHPPLYPSCAACHGANGAGGKHFPDGAVSADLRHKALVTDQKPPYDLRLLERAIATGIDNTGHPLDPVMPHWRLSPADLHDVALYVLTGNFSAH